MNRFTISIFLLISAAVLLFFGLFPQWQNVAGLRSSVRSLTLLNDELQEIAAMRDTLTEEYNKISQGDLAKLSRVLPPYPATTDFLNDLEALAAHHGVVVKSIDFLKQERPTGAPLQLPSRRYSAPLAISMNIRGTYASLRSFLKDAEKMTRIFDMSEISFTAQAADERQAFDYAMRGTIYYSR